MQDDFLFPGTVNIFRPQYGLPAGLHAPCRSEDMFSAMMLAGALRPAYTVFNACEISHAHLPKPVCKQLLRAFVFSASERL